MMFLLRHSLPGGQELGNYTPPMKAPKPFCGWHRREAVLHLLIVEEKAEERKSDSLLQS